MHIWFKQTLTFLFLLTCKKSPITEVGIHLELKLDNKVVQFYNNLKPLKSLVERVVKEYTSIHIFYNHRSKFSIFFLT